ncbi:MAG: LON peptidase substrate-binding domain-containing protein [Actinomycetota bacterium]|nr:LON peptidase substrate-binding domain-containing protein [Actinomycetota bacterium]
MSDPGGAAVPLPMFPLGTVLFPHMVLPLHVFEPRYREMTADCLRHGQQFGVVLIERGSEVGGGDVRFGVGTAARIVEALRFPDGRWALVCVGTHRVRVNTWLPDDPYPLALVEDMADGGLDAAGLDALAVAEREVRRALALASELDEPVAPADADVDADPSMAAWQLAALAPLGPVDRQRVLEEDDPVARLQLLAGLVSEAAAALAYRLSGG